MKSEDIRNYFSDYLAGELSAEDNANFEAILLEDAEIRADLRSMKNIVESLHDLPEQPLPDDFSAFLHQRLISEKAAQPRKKGLFNIGWVKPLTAVAVLVFFVAIANSGVLGGLSKTADDTANMTAYDYDTDTGATEEMEMGGGYGASAPSMDMDEEMPQDKSMTDDSIANSDGMTSQSVARENQSMDIAAVDEEDISGDAVTERKVIKNTDISIETEDYEKAFNEISAMATEYGGYVVSGYTNNDDEGKPDSGYLSIRVESDTMDTALSEIRLLGDVKNENFYGEDVTSQYVDVQSRLKQYRIQEERLLDLFDQATTVTDMISIESELSRVRAEIESLEGQIRYLTQVTDLALININIRVPNHLSSGGTDFSDWHSFWQKLSSSFVSGINFVAGLIANAIFVFGYILPILLIIVVLIVVVWLIVKAARRKRLNK